LRKGRDGKGRDEIEFHHLFTSNLSTGFVRVVCCQRPRKLGAKYTGHDIAPDEFVQPSLEFDYEGKRDRWNGYDPAAYRHVVDDYQKLEETKRQLKAQKMEAALLEGALDESVAKVTLLLVLLSWLIAYRPVFWHFQLSFWPVKYL